MDNTTLETIIANVARDTGASNIDIHLGFGWYDGEVCWCCEIPRGRTCPQFQGYGASPQDAAKDAVEHWRRWKHPEIADRESKARLLKEMGLSDEQIAKVLK